MNGPLITYILGKVLQVFGGFLMLPCVTALIYGEKEGISFLIVAFISTALGTIVSLKKPEKLEMYSKDGFVVTALAWILISIMGAIPFTLCGDIPSYVDALFETVSGFTTTGASILNDVEALCHASLLWRSFTHWIGGMGVLVFLMSILSLADGNNMYMMKAESPGPTVGKLVPKVKYSARILYLIYILMTLIQITLLVITGMPWFHAITISFGTAGTGGFGILNDSTASYTWIQQDIITVFMLLFGVNFSIYFLLFSKKVKECFKSEEVKWYFRIFFIAVALITMNSIECFQSVREAIHHVAFTVASIMTTTGFATRDFGVWPVFCQTVLLLLMFCGACAGSTGGGIKVSRVVTMVKIVRRELSYLLHPRRMKPIKVNDEIVDKTTIRSIEAFFICYILILLGSTLLLTLNNVDFTTNFTAVVSAINNIGPGLNQVGPTCNFSFFSPFQKFVLMFDMLAGRLEIFPIMILFFRSTWKK